MDDLDLMMGGTGGQSSGTPAPGDMNAPLHPMIQHYEGNHAAARAQFDKLKEAQSRLSTTRGVMDGLVALGDSVEEKNLIKSAGKLVAAGIEPASVAGLLADAPENGEALQGWLKQQDSILRKNEQITSAMLGMSRQAMGVEALRALIAHAAVPTLFGGANDGGGGAAQPSAPSSAAPQSSPLDLPSEGAPSNAG